MKNSQVLFLSHGGGPMPLLGDESHQQMVDTLQSITKTLRKPKAILVISAHWEETTLEITAAESPSLYYDYYGFPDESYQIKYPCKGEPALAKNIQLTLKTAGIDSQLNSERGLDHGVFIPLKIMYPAADIPCLQISLHKNLDPNAHISIGEALQTLDVEDLLIIGSGFSFHNMKQFFAPETQDAKTQNESFEHWLIDTCTNKTLDETQRKQRLIAWDAALGARFCHPREEHLLPLHVCYGAVQRPCDEYYALAILNKQASMYLWR